MLNIKKKRHVIEKLGFVFEKTESLMCQSLMIIM